MRVPQARSDCRHVYHVYAVRSGERDRLREALTAQQIQTGIHDRWARANAEYNRQGGQRDSKPLTVARAILEDFEAYLPKL